MTHCCPRGDVSVSRPTIVISQLAVADYRIGFYDALAERNCDLRVYAGNSYFTPTIRTIPHSRSWLTRTGESHYLFRRRMAWMNDIPIQARDVFVHEWNPRILSLWRDMIKCRRAGAQFLVWGHAWGKGGAYGVPFQVRRLVARMADGVVCYTERQADFVRRITNKRAVIAAPNACLSRSDCRVSGEETSRRDVIYVGRLVPEKKLLLLVDGFSAACRQPSFRANLLIVGEGPEKVKIQARARALGIEERVILLGHQSEIAVLRGAYGRAFVSVSPAYVGLSFTQSLGFGVPALIAAGETHSPEIEAAREGWNARFFTKDSSASLGAKLIEAWQTWRGVAALREDIAAWVAKEYTFETMAERFEEIARVLLMKASDGARGETGNAWKAW